MNNIHQPEPEIKEDLHGRIEVFDQNIRSLEKRLRAIERRLTLEITSPQAGRIHSGNFSDPFSEDNEGVITVGSSVFPHGPSVSPESSIPGNPFLSKAVPSFSEENISSFALSAVVPSGETSNVSVISLDNTSDVCTPGYKIRDINYLFSGLTESLRSLQTAMLEISNFVHNELQPEIEKLDIEVKNLKNQECIINEDIKKLESHIETIENQNRLTFGSLRIPLEISGIVGSSVLFLTGFLVWSGRWDVIRSPYFSTGLAVLMAGAVFIKFYTINSEKKSLVDR